MGDERPVSVITPTVQDGTVVRWYASLDAAEHHDEMASASRNAVEFYRDEIPARVRDAAQAAHRELSGNPGADVRHYATHEHTGAFGGRLVPVRGGG